MTEAQGWKPTPFEVMALAVATLADTPPEFLEAVLAHGSPIRDDELDRRLLESLIARYHDETIGKIVINGLGRAECEALTIAYAGCEAWETVLLEGGVTEEDIVTMTPSRNTAVEAEKFLSLIQDRGWNDVGISSQPHHQPRCFLTAVAEMNRRGCLPNVYNLPAPGVGWNRELYKPVMGGGRAVSGCFSEHVKAELDRIEIYAQEPTPEKPFTQHATIPQALAYLESRERRRLAGGNVR